MNMKEVANRLHAIKMSYDVTANRMQASQVSPITAVIP